MTQNHNYLRLREQSVALDASAAVAEEQSTTKAGRGSKSKRLDEQ